MKKSHDYPIDWIKNIINTSVGISDKSKRDKKYLIDKIDTIYKM